MKATWLAGTAVLIGLGCGKSSSSGGDGGTVTAAQACADLAKAECAKRMTCSPVNVALVFGGTNGMQTCIDRETISCTAGLAAPDTGNTPSMVEECVTEFATESCADYHQNNPPAACSAIGTRTKGMPCTFNGQCTTNYCGGAKNALCGSCDDPPAAGSSCASSACYHGQECVEATSLCQPYGSASASCDADNPCGDGLSCTGAVASTSTPGTCQPVSEPNAACGGTMPGCDGYRGYFCGGATGAKTCGTISYVGDGMACGNMSGASFAQCLAGGCYTATGLATGSETGTCKANAADGAPCDPVLGPGCLTPARCVPGGDAGDSVCALPTAAGCG